MKAAIDTNIAVYFLNNDKTVVELIQRLDTICLPVTVCGELLFGIKNSSKAAENFLNYLQLAAISEILNIHDAVSDEYANVRLELKKKGKPIPENDIWIAATCIVNDIPLITNDTHFENISNLQLIKLNN